MLASYFVASSFGSEYLPMRRGCFGLRALSKFVRHCFDRQQLVIAPGAPETFV